MKKYLNSVVAKFDTTASGNAATGTTITVRDSSTGLKVTLYSDDGVTQKDNPFTVDNNGNYEFYVADGRYDIYQDEGLATQLILRDVSIFDVSINFGAPKTATALVSNIFNFGVGSLLTVGGYAAQGDGGTGQWLKTADTDTASQSPLVRQDGTLTDVRGAVWRLVVTGDLDPRAVGFTCVNDETASLTAACVAVGEGGTVALDKSYQFSFNGLRGAFYCTIDFAKSTVISTTADYGILIEGEFTEQVSVSSVSSETITVADASGYTIGDVVKITSTDDQPDYWTANRKVGQFAIITNKVGSVLTVDRPIIDDTLYQNNVTLFKMEKHSCCIKNLDITVSAGLSDHLTVIELQGMYRPKLENVNVFNAKDSTTTYVSCYEYEHINCSAVNSLDSQGTGNFGYGVYDAGSHGGYVDNYKFNNGRHAFTNGGFTSSTVNPLCGITTDVVVANSIARCATAGAWDTHPNAFNVQFVDCQAYDSANFGQVRSRNVSFINPYGRRLNVAIAVASGLAGSTINPSKGARVINPDLGYGETAIAHYTGETLPRTDIADIYIEGGKFVVEGDYRGFLLESRSNPIKATFRNVSVDVDNIETDALVFLGNYAGHEISIDGMDFKADSNTGGTFSVVRGQYAFGALQHEVDIQRVTFSGAGSEDLTLYAAANLDAHVNDVRAKSVGTGSLTAVTNGTSLTWGGAV